MFQFFFYDNDIKKLNEAIDNERIELIEEMIRNNKRLMNNQDAFNQTPLMIAAKKGSLLSTRALLSYGASIGLKDINGYSAFTLAAKNGHYHVLEAILEDWHQQQQKDYLKINYGVLEDFAKTITSFKEVRRLEFERYDENILLPIAFALAVLNKKVSFLYLKFRSQDFLAYFCLFFFRNWSAKPEKTFLMWLNYAILFEFLLDTAHLLLSVLPKQKYNVSDELDKALFLTVEEGHQDCLELLLKESHFDINSKNQNDETLLMVAARKNYPGILSFLIEKGADLFIDRRGYDACKIAVERGYLQSLKALLKAHKNQIPKDSSKYYSQILEASIIDAARCNHLAMTRFLAKQLRYHGNFEYFMSALNIASSQAAKNSHKTVLEYLLNQGADPDNVLQRLSSTRKPREKSLYYLLTKWLYVYLDLLTKLERSLNNDQYLDLSQFTHGLHFEKLTHLALLDHSLVGKSEDNNEVSILKNVLEKLTQNYFLTLNKSVQCDDLSTFKAILKRYHMPFNTHISINNPVMKKTLERAQKQEIKFLHRAVRKLDEKKVTLLLKQGTPCYLENEKNCPMDITFSQRSYSRSNFEQRHATVLSALLKQFLSLETNTSTGIEKTLSRVEQIIESYSSRHYNLESYCNQLRWLHQEVIPYLREKLDDLDIISLESYEDLINNNVRLSCLFKDNTRRPFRFDDLTKGSKHPISRQRYSQEDIITLPKAVLLQSLAPNTDFKRTSKPQAPTC